MFSSQNGQLYLNILLLFAIVFLSLFGVCCSKGEGVDIDNNCAHMREDENFDGAAVGLESFIRGLRGDHRTQLALMYVLDSELTLSSTSPEQRIRLNKHCERSKAWRAAEGNKEICFAFLTQVQPLNLKKNQFDADAMVVGEKESKQSRLMIHTRTERAKECFDEIKTKTIHLRHINSNIVDQASKAKTSVEDKVYEGVKEGTSKESPTAILVIQRVAGTVVDPERNRNFKVHLIFMSPYHNSERLHYMKVVGLLSPQKMKELVKKRDFSFDELMKKFGIQAVIVTSPIAENVIRKLIHFSNKQGVVLFTTGKISVPEPFVSL